MNCKYFKKKLQGGSECKRTKQSITLKDCSKCLVREFKEVKPLKPKYKKDKNKLSIMPINSLYSIEEKAGCHKHHVFGGRNRPNSEKYGLFVWLLPKDHTEGKKIGHVSKELDNLLKKEGKKAFIKKYSKEKFIETFKYIKK